MTREPFTPRRQLRVEPARGGGRPFANFLAYEVRPCAATEHQAVTPVKALHAKGLLGLQLQIAVCRVASRYVSMQ